MGSPSMKTSNAVLLLLVVVAVSMSLSSARYLPTRSDNSRQERVKDALRLLLEMAEAVNDPSSGGTGRGGLEGQSLYDVRPNLISKRSTSTGSSSEYSPRSIKSGI